MKNRYFFITLLAIVLCGCHHQGNLTSTIKVDYTTVVVENLRLGQDKEIALSEFVDHIDIIPLEFKDSCILKGIRKVVALDSNLFIIEDNRPERVYRFDTQGNFLNSIGEKGQGPDEIIELSDFSLNEKEQLIYLLDNGRKTVLAYNFEGQLVEKIKVNHADRLEYKDGFFYLFRDEPTIDDLCCLNIRNTKGEFKNAFLPSHQYPISKSSQVFTKTKDNLFLIKPMNDTIYSLDEVELKYAYYFDFGSLRLTPKEIEDSYSNEIPTFKKILIDKERVSSMDHLYQTRHWIGFNKGYKLLQYLFLYNKDTKELKAGQVWDDLEYMFYGTSFYGQTENAWIGVYAIERIHSNIERYKRYADSGYITEEQKVKYTQKMKNLMRGENPEEMNPWILFYHLKE
ncbi:hypothetical protein FACS189432_00980 [Bacteroidia bacterium]|nr:hypothetical protein FACS189426_03240 [Bacteroidia bacterium]GHT26486.1 hypothetical protein FACS189432_00980 [Bacteroidia bacterium]